MRRLYLSALAAIVALFAVPTMAQNLQHCAPRDQVVARLADKYGESRQAVGLGSNNAVMEVFANIEGGSWTITVTMANGMTCLIASGQAYEALAEALPPKGDAL
ncbi:hypothetical protein [Tropicibacter alexandrii]|uniref:hypothetical protein n=1 Tax=Tropicibacter alexandrii TaxID=2267683 RepID=UPI0010088EA3|nr:hypothetical protein [Tropicibacter alexandrii]